jgi:hypothetical protein
MTDPQQPSIDSLVARLKNHSNAEAAAQFPRDRAAVSYPGLYSWWADDQGLAALSVVFDHSLPPLIYAGQAGATSARSGTERVATLASRIGGNHLNGGVSSSTFRKTLTAVLLKPLGLRLERENRLTAESNQVVSAWMRAHLSIVTAPCPDRGTLAALEDTVLQELDPPLNLMGMAPSVVRAQLRSLRRRLREQAR